MIRINNIYKEQILNKTRVYSDILINENKRTIWFEVDSEYGEYLVDDRIDAYAIGLLNFAMKNNMNIVSDYPITEELLYNINEILIPSLSTYAKSLSKIRITAPTVQAITEGKENGTGISCGIDSFSAIKNHYHTEYKELDVTYLCINNVGAFNNCYSEYGVENVQKERYKITDDVAIELGLKLIKTDSNFGTEIPQVHYLTNTYSGCFAIYMMQKFWKRYYLGSVGLDYSKFTIINNDLEDSAHYDLLTLQCFSHSGLKIYSEGGEKSRLEKTNDLVDFVPAQKYLHVCIKKPYNCNICPKCMRTLVSLDALKKLDNFRNVFDIDYYNNHRSYYYKWLCRQHLAKDEMNEPVYQVLKKRNNFRKITFWYRILFYTAYKTYKSLKIIVSKIF